MKRIIYGSLSVLTAITTAFVSAKAEAFNAESGTSIQQAELAEANAGSITTPTAQAQVTPAVEPSEEMTEEEAIEAGPTEAAPADGVVTPIAPTSDELAPIVPPTPAQPGLTEPGLTEPELGEPELIEPGVTEPGLMIEPDVAEPDMSEPGLTEPGLTEPDLTEPDLTEPGLGESELDELEGEPVPPAPGFPSAPIEPEPGFPSAPVEPAPLPPLEEDTPLDDSAVPGDDFPIGASSSDRLVGEGFTPFQLSYLAIAGGLKEEGIPGGSILLSAYGQGDISAADIVDAGALSNRLGTAADDQADYTDGVDRFLELLERDARND